MDALKKIFGLLSIALILMLIGNKAMFWHTHQCADGSVINHAHPYSKSQESQSEKQHQHNNFELVFLQQLLILNLIVFIAFYFLSKADFSLLFLSTENKKLSNLINPYRLRGPPVIY